ncbi:hypothetical protein [Actinomadura macra]|uniref:hypothetical protein n=1 Tax=Actinomadura macra TaxID=46164 RepID=UPI000835618A|nr:hypothetical protein [Actinomadura macra]
MGRASFWTVLVRIVAVIAGLTLVGLVLRLISGILAPLLPTEVWAALAGGWRQVYGLVAPAAGALGALAILVAIVYVIIGTRR